MAVLHCKTCGAKVKLTEGKLTADCEYCGNEMIVFDSTAEFEVDSKGVLVQYNGKGGDVVLPDGIVKIGSHAFYQNDRVLTLKVPQGVMAIGDHAFAECGELEQIELPESLESIADYAFAECSCLTSIRIPEGILAIKPYTFSNCRNLKNVTLPDSVRKIEERAFLDCKKLQTVNMPARLRSIGRSAFLRCSSLTQIRFGDKLESIEKLAFSDCTCLQYVNLPDSLESMGSMCFQNCTALKEIHFPANLSSIPGWCFEKCSSLTELHIPGTVKNIEKYAFQYCKGIKTLTLDEGVETVDCDAFCGLSSLSGTLVVPQSMTGMSMPKFTQITQLVIGKPVEHWDYASNFSKSLTKLTILPGVKQLSKAAFYNCSQLKTVELPEGLEVIGENAFWDCISLEEITLPSSLVTIGSRGFQNCRALKAVGFRSIKDAKLESIMDHAFEDCPQLSEISLPASLRTIGNSAFDYSASLQSVKIPNGCQQIGEDAFATTEPRNCDFYLPGTIQHVGRRAFLTDGRSRVHSPKNAAIENYCREHRDYCSWYYLPSVQEQRAAQQGKVDKLKQEQLAAANRKAAAERAYNDVATQIDQEFALLKTLTGVFAGGKRKKCQERIDVLRKDATAKLAAVDQCSAQLTQLTAQIQAEEANLSKLGT